MAIRTVLHFPDPRLRNIGKMVDIFDSSLHQLIDDMFETMYDEKGIGLAATQIGVALQLSVIDLGADSGKLVIANPKLELLGTPQLMQEGCLSVPGIYDTVLRYPEVRLTAQDQDGKVFELEANGLLAHALQHEYDHLQGKLYVDYLSQLKRMRIQQKLEKLKKR